MKLPVTGLCAFVIGLVATHMIVLGALPGYIMSKMRDRMTDRGIAVHQWQMSPRVTTANPDHRASLAGPCLCDLPDRRDERTSDPVGSDLAGVWITLRV